MLKERCAFCLLLHLSISLGICGRLSTAIMSHATSQKLTESGLQLMRSSASGISSNSSMVNASSTNCVQNVCNLICSNCSSFEIEYQISTLLKQNRNQCTHIEKLQLYNIAFPGNILAQGFLGHYSDKVDELHIVSSHVTDIESGAFGRGRYRRIHLQDLQLRQLKKGFFQDISPEFTDLAIIQKEVPLQVVPADFLYHVKFQIRYLAIQAGLKSLGNITAGDYVLDNLWHADFSNNDLILSSFGKVPSVEYLDLSHSNLTYLPPDIFEPLILEFLDLSHNRLTTISYTIFGNRRTSLELQVLAEDNAWSCSCSLQNEFKKLMQPITQHILCSEPKAFKGLSVFDARICEEKIPSTEILQSTTENISYPNISLSNNSTDLLKLECLTGHSANSERFTHRMQGPHIAFTLTPSGDSRVDVVVDLSAKAYDRFSLIWFSKVDGEHYKMEISYNEFGLDCYNATSFATTVEGLLPQTGYTFCLMLKQHLTVSPFNCQSLRTSRETSEATKAWLTRDLRMTGLLLVVFGIIMFLIVGILIAYLLLKWKPVLLKSSPSVKPMPIEGADIVSLSLSTKERAHKSTNNGCCNRRRHSADSEASSSSYMTTNLYEVVQTYRRQYEPDPQPFSINSENSYLTPVNSSASLVQYTEIPCQAEHSRLDAPPHQPPAKPSIILDWM